MMSVEGLHTAFQTIDARMAKMIGAGRTDGELASCLRREWSNTFHRDLSAPAVKGMVSHYRAVHRVGARRTRRRRQKGGMAPLDYMMGQGTTAAVYGRFPVAIDTNPTVIQSLDMNRFFESPIGRSCNATGGYDAPTQMGGATAQRGSTVEELKHEVEQQQKGKQQTGGGVLDAIGMGHMPASVPRNIVEMGVSAVQGHPIANPNSSPVAATVHVPTSAPAPYDATAINPITSLAPIYQSY
jgi:hypothetical protein